MADDAGLLSDACDNGDGRAGSQHASSLSSVLQRNFCQSPMPKRTKYVYCEHCLREVSEKTYRNHCNLHFPCRDRDQQAEGDWSMMQENAEPGMLLQFEWWWMCCWLTTSVFHPRIVASYTYWVSIGLNKYKQLYLIQLTIICFDGVMFLPRDMQFSNWPHSLPWLCSPATSSDERKIPPNKPLYWLYLSKLASR